MKKIILLLMILPIVAFAGQMQESKNVERFKYLCEHSNDPSMRQHYCHILEEYKKADVVVNEYKDSNAGAS